MSIEELERRISRLEDMHQINNVQSRYEHFLSMGNFFKIVDLFAQKDPNVSVEIADSGVYTGIEGIKRLYIALNVDFLL